MSLVIGISKASGGPKYDNYVRWIRSAGEDIEIVDLIESQDLPSAMSRIDALLLTGGPDIDPAYYHQPDATGQCEAIDEPRDEAEFRMLEIAEERELPVLAICRGIQAINVFYGGSLLPHVPDRLNGSLAHSKDGENDRRHPIEVTPGSLLFKATGELEGEVNSAHHQAPGDIAPGMIASAMAPDGMIEALEWRDAARRSYMLGVQWHPERLEQESPFAGRILEQFIFEARSAKVLAGVRKAEPRERPEEPPEMPPQTGGSPLLPIVQ